MISAIARWEWTADGPMTGWGSWPGSVACPDLRAVPDCGLAGDYGDWPWSVFIFDKDAELPEDAYVLGEGRFEEIRPSTAARTRWAECFGAKPEGDTLLDWYVWQMTYGSTPDGSAPCKPIMPTHLRVAEFHLPLHSLAWKKHISRLDLSDPYHNRILDVVKHDFRQLLADVDNERGAIGKTRAELAKQQGGKRSEKAEREKQDAALKKRDESLAELPGKVLGGLVVKYGFPAAEINAEVEPRKPTTTTSDDFSGDLSAWTQNQGTWSISSGELRKTANNNTYQTIRHDTSLSSDDHYSQVLTTTGGTNTTFHGPATRWNTTTGYFMSHYTGDPQWTGLYLCKALSSSYINFQFDTYAEPSTLRLTSDGSSHTMKRGSTSYSAVTDTSYSGTLTCGLQCFAASTSTIFDDFEAADLLAPTIIPKIIHHRKQMGVS